MNLLPDRTLPLPHWLPEERRRRLSGKRIRVRIRRGVRSRLRTLARIPVSEWSEQHRRMPSAESFEGKWRREFAPHAVRIMDWWAMPWVREVWFCGPDQASKTNTMLSCLGWAIERDPGNVFYTMQDEKKVKEIVADKLIPMLRLTDPLRRLLSKKMDDTSIGKIRMANGVHIRAAWASSAGSTATFSAKYTFNDEVDKWEMTGKETDPIRRIKKRAKNFPLEHKHFFGSTPAGKYIYKGTMSCAQVHTYAGRCPHCGELVVMDEERFVIPDGWGPAEIKSDPEAIGYACNACSVIWDEYDRKSAYENGDWVCIKGQEVERPASIGVHLTGFVTPDMRMADIATTLVEARAGDLGAKRDLAHGIKCIDFEEETVAREEDNILVLCDERPAGVLPSAEIAALLLTVDTQKDHFYYVLRAWGFGMEQDSWQVRCGIAPSFSALERLLYETEYVDANGRRYAITAGGIDTGGTTHHDSEHSRTYQVYDWCRQHPKMLAFKGGSRQAAPWRVGNVDFFPGTNKPIPGGLKLYTLNTTYYKDELDRRLQIAPSDPGAFRLHSGFDAGQLARMQSTPGLCLPNGLQDYAKHLCGEYRDERGQWQERKGRRHDYWDCENYQIALADILGVKHWKAPENGPAPAQKPPATSAPSAGRSRPGWFRGR